MIERLFQRRQLQDPSWYQFLFGNVWLAPVWLVLRVYLGWQWLQAGWEKITGSGWVDHDGASLRAFWTRIVAVPDQGQPPIKYDWYRDFIQFMLDHHWYSWFAYVIALGETAIGIFLIIGAFCGIAAIAGATLNFNFMLAGSASTNPVLFLLAVLILLGWKVAGYIGLDRWLLPALGTPWDSGTAQAP
jgi:thiosulfate dehydrogenase [quinone] large subunit